MFFWIGLSLSLLLVVIAFNWKTYDQTGLVDLGDVGNDFDEIIDVPASIQPPPPPPQKVEVFVVKEVDDETVIEEVEIDLDVELTEDMQIEEVVFDEVLEEPEEKAEEIFQIVEDKPEFPGGLKAFYEYVGENVSYPAAASRLGVTGRVFVRFVIEKDGSLTDITVIKGIGSGCDEEAVRVLENSPPWTPGKQRGNKVRVYMTVPIYFKLSQ
ncbi:MAG: energy transducer TonB [Cyclobacteriaceae bacterium]